MFYHNSYLVSWIKVPKCCKISFYYLEREKHENHENHWYLVFTTLFCFSVIFPDILLRFYPDYSANGMFGVFRIEYISRKNHEM